MFFLVSVWEKDVFSYSAFKKDEKRIKFFVPTICLLGFLPENLILLYEGKQRSYRIIFLQMLVCMNAFYYFCNQTNEP